MDKLQRSVMAIAKVLEFRRSHDVAEDYQGRVVCQTRATVVFREAPTPGEQFIVTELIAGDTELGEGHERAGFRAWLDADDYGRPLVEVYIVDVEVPSGVAGTTAAA